MMERLVIMSRPAMVAGDGLDVLRVIVAERPDITWGQLAAEADRELRSSGGLGAPMNGWLTSAINVVGAAADPFTFGATSKTLKAMRDVGYSVFDQRKVKDSVTEAGRGIFDDAVNRLLDALPGGLGNRIRVGTVVTDYVFPLAIAGAVVWFLFLRKRRR